MRLKKAAAFAMAAMMSVATLTGCGDKSTSDTTQNNTQENTQGEADSEGSTGEVEAITLKVWSPEEEVSVTQQMCDSFQEAHPEYDITFDISVMGNDETTDALTTDPDTAADVFYMPSGGIAQLTEAGLIYPITVDLDTINSRYGEGALAACTKDGLLYGIPSTPNCWFMYYNKSMYTEDEVQSLETMMAKDLGDDIKNFSCSISNSWYLEAFFYAAGCTVFGPDGTDPTICDWNSENGVAAANYAIDLANNDKYVEDLDGIAGSLFKDGKLGALCSGTWAAGDLKGAVGDDFGAVALPTINVNGSDSRLSNFADYRCISVKSNTAYPLAAQQLAEWMGNEENQLLLYTECAVAPACLALQENETVAADVATCALIAQTEYATPQPSISQISEYWNPVTALGEGIINGEITKDNVQSQLDAVVEGITGSLVE